MACSRAVSRQGNLTVEAWNPAASFAERSIVSYIPWNFDTTDIPSVAELHVGLELGATENALIEPSSLNKIMVFVLGSEQGQCPEGGRSKLNYLTMSY